MQESWQTVWAKNLSDEFLCAFWQKALAQKVAQATFYEYLPPTPEDFCSWVRGQDLRFIQNYQGEAIAMYWLNNPLGKAVMIHFCFLKEAVAHREAVGRYVTKGLLEAKINGEYVVSALMGITPKKYRHALNYIKILGFELVAELPEACFFSQKKRYEGAVISILTRNKRRNLMGGGGKTPSFTTPEVAAVEVPAPLPTSVDESVKLAGDEERRKIAAASGKSSTVLTSSSGLTNQATTQKKEVLGG